MRKKDSISKISKVVIELKETIEEKKFSKIDLREEEAKNMITHKQNMKFEQSCLNFQ